MKSIPRSDPRSSRRQDGLTYRLSRRDLLIGRLSMRQLPVRPDEVTGVAVRIALQVILMLGLGFPERSGRGHLGDNLARPQAGRIDIGNGVFRDPFLLVIGIENRRAVAGSPVIALTVQ